jgi:hypothetical protein
MPFFGDATNRDVATAIAAANVDQALHQRMEWFFKKYAPVDKREAAEFHADLMMVVQAVHRDASRHTHDLLAKALSAMPMPAVFMPMPEKKDAPDA